MIEYSNDDLIRVVNNWVHSARDRDILIKHYVDGITYEKIAELHDLSTRQIANIIYKYEKTIFKYI